MDVLLDSSQEVKDAKKKRTFSKGVVTRMANQLKKDLELEPGGKYDFQKIDKFSIESDAEKLKVKLEELKVVHENYAEAGRKVLVEKSVEAEVLSQFEDELDTYWTESRKEATRLLNLYKFEYSTSLKRYLANIDEEGKAAIVTPNPSVAEQQKAKKKADADLQRQLYRWKILKTEWYCQLQEGERVSTEIKDLSNEDLLKMSLLLDYSSLSSSLKEHWGTIKSFLETLQEVFEASGIDLDTALMQIEFDTEGEAKRMHGVLTQLNRLIAVKKEIEKKHTLATTTSEVGATDPSEEKELIPLKMDRIQTPKFSDSTKRVGSNS